MLRRAPLALASLLVLALVAGCGKKDAGSTAGGATSDSLLSANPVEQPQGQMEGQTSAPAGESTAVAPAPGTQGSTPAPAASGTPSKSKGSSKGVTLKPKAGSGPSSSASAADVTVPGGTNLSITMGTALNTETAQPGQAWSGTLKEAITIGATAPFPAGSTVSGVIESMRPAAKGERAMMVLRVTSIEANGHTHSISATADSLVAGSTRARNVGAIAGGAAAGALIGKALGGSGKSAVIGGILGGAAATGAVAASKGYQVDVPAGKDLVFHVDHDTKVKL